MDDTANRTTNGTAAVCIGFVRAPAIHSSSGRTRQISEGTVRAPLDEVITSTSLTGISVIWARVGRRL